ncbi:hypothetical protein FJ492_12625 [Mesorhizobium sp. B2-5-4]|uniref:hypothetical protein n=1 Tax=unclassified Mesorhizobium TaxID=325217 RepID=UPI0004835CD5|nr:MULTISPECIES: hypothetical protein [unclassified Mesorhizobium]TPJ44326.1 hypothetical protein FJ432_04810 [Mesorhizobium sp. B2-6-5]TPJ90670.1 hypothetical protein FJ434_06640 [Mesorhizobium sp. B2-5-13]TPK44258.1 hypothetical protein FJ492_12625 [Mesorhizobium sp. B2-5-4]TPK54697.1 hypothetical protein FJ560_01835 [Mesorhizobium sp. B2-5-5]TPL86301.1 hypothetical protein FJ941_06450 [Mesorhizobium sp. B2-3-13]
MQAIRTGVSWAGLVSGPAAWAITLQLDYSTAFWQCHASFWPTALFSLIGAAAATAGALLSWRAIHDRGHGTSPPLKARTRMFLARTSVGIGALFTLVMLTQMLAGLTFSGCEL